MTNQLELRHLNYFLVLAETLHYGIAAERLYISQSALSQQIQRLEVILGQQLFKRHNRKVTLSRAGELFREEADLVANQLNTSMERWRFRVDGGEGIIRIGFVASVMQTFLPRVLMNLNSKHPKIKFYLEDLSNKDQLTALKKKKLDVCFVRTSLIAPTMKSFSIFRENLTLVLPESHPIDAKNFKNMKQLKEESFILFPNEQSQTYYQQVINLCGENGFIPRVRHRSIHGPTIFKLVESGLGISVIPNSLKDERNYRVKFIELNKIPQKSELFAVWNRDSDNLALSHFLSILKS